MARSAAQLGSRSGAMRRKNTPRGRKLGDLRVRSKRDPCTSLSVALFCVALTVVFGLLLGHGDDCIYDHFHLTKRPRPLRKHWQFLRRIRGSPLDCLHEQSCSCLPCLGHRGCDTRARHGCVRDAFMRAEPRTNDSRVGARGNDDCGPPGPWP